MVNLHVVNLDVINLDVVNLPLMWSTFMWSILMWSTFMWLFQVAYSVDGRMVATAAHEPPTPYPKSLALQWPVGL